MAANYDREVRLEGDELEQARGAENDVVSALNTMAGLVVHAVEGSSDKAVDLDAAKFTYVAAAGTLVVHGPEYCYVYDGEHQVCRPCTAAEEVIN